MNKEKIEYIAELFKALAHPTRFQIVAGLIKRGESNVSEITESLNIPQPTISQHISILKTHKIIEGYRNGNQICYRAVNEQVKKIFKILE